MNREPASVYEGIDTRALDDSDNEPCCDCVGNDTKYQNRTMTATQAAMGKSVIQRIDYRAQLEQTQEATLSADGAIDLVEG